MVWPRTIEVGMVTRVGACFGGQQCHCTKASRGLSVIAEFLVGRGSGVSLAGSTSLVLSWPWASTSGGQITVLATDALPSFMNYEVWHPTLELWRFCCICPQSPERVCVYFSFVWFVYVAMCPPGHTQYIFHTPMARYSLYVLKVPLNTNNTNKPRFRWITIALWQITVRVSH